MKPCIAIVGRPNVGKSSLFNRLARRQIALVYDQPGVTRDRISAECSWNGKEFTLMDTGGIGLDDESGFESAIQHEVDMALQVATHVLLVVDGREGLHPLDQEVARRLRKGGKPACLVVNKVDSDKQSSSESDFARMGLEPVFPISAAHGTGIGEMMSDLTKEWNLVEGGEGEEKQLEGTRITLVGRPNAGKSSLINALLKESRVIVSETAGTTRDAVDVDLVWNGEKFCLIDTAGLRKKSRVHDALEQAMASRSAHTINRAHVCVLVIDAVVGAGMQEKKIAGLINEAGRPCLVLVNKWDLAVDMPDRLPPGWGGNEGVRPQTFRQQYEEALRSALFFLDYAPVVFASALRGDNLDRWMGEVAAINRRRAGELPAGLLNRVIGRAMERHTPPARNRRCLKIYYAAQIKDQTTRPTIAAFINDKSLWSEDYRRYLEQALRKEFDLAGCPIRWVLRDKKKAAERTGATPSPRSATPRARKKAPRKRVR